jgi:membrane protein
LSLQFLPPEANAVIEDQVRKIQSSAPTGVLSLSFVVLLWSSSSTFIAVMDATNAAYGSRDQRPWWRRRVMAVVLTVIESALLIAALVAILAWAYVMAWVGLGSAPPILAALFQWVVVVALLLVSFSIAYYFGTEVKHPWEWVTPGGTLGVLALIAATLGFRLYLRYGFSFSETYGALAGVVVLLLWLYIAALSLLVGAEINSVIDEASPSHNK